MASTFFLTGFPGPAGVLDVPNAGQFPIGVGADSTNLQAARGLSYLIRATVRDPNQNVVLIGPPYPAGMLDFTNGFQVEWPGKKVTIYPAASMSRSSIPTDDPPNLWVPGKLGPINYGISLFDGIEPSGVGRGGVGAIILSDPDGELDGHIDYSWDGSTLDILRGGPLELYSSYEVIARMTTAGILYDQRKKELRLRDASWILDNAELHGLKYGGTGGSDGDASLAGIDRPYCIGPAPNITPVMMNSEKLVYQVSCSSIRAVVQVRDGGVPIAFDADYPTWDALIAAPITDLSKYATCLALGYIRMGLPPVKSITADVEGDNDTINFQTYPETRGQIARRIATGRGAVKLKDAEVDFVALNKLEQNQTGVCGYYWPRNVQKGAALTEVMSGCLGYWAVKVNGQLVLGSLDEPSGIPALSLTPSDICSEPEMLSTYQSPRRGSYVGWGRNYTVQDPSQLAGEVIDSGDFLNYGRDTKYAKTESSVVQYMFKNSQLVYCQGNFQLESAAQSESVRQQRVMGVRRERWRVKIMCDPFSDLLGKVIEITNFNRYSWGTSKKFVCVGMSFASGIFVELELWG